ncbi:MAG: DUF3732 domain-containing protein [Humidesulfovibrio sp.]|uniref:DUF3732 domain-containing protein n=1 Tax=Humidesulfovibrio sp. TaxID=2910988 RepID=UPI0027350685|nr:DUF3732 domain-containing protein [Humidesulfovibrio sp.]MDP2847546.1 DUF3732 domain-containing protein [Humidesulfovibrio sp.]
MQLQIKELILWPKDLNREPRTVKFELGKVNVITGASRTGKSAIIPIIDYCLCSSKCSIPVGIIRDTCSWFGIVLSTIQGDILLARRNPEDQKQTGDMFVLEGNQIVIPSVIPEKNDDSEDVKRRLSELSGLPMLDYGQEDRAFTTRPSFRDVISFLFQSQNIIANQDILFYKANEHKYQERLRNIFPFVLNAVDAEWFYNKHLFNELNKQLRIKEKELEGIQSLFQKWVADIRTKIIKAKELGLINDEVSIDGNPEYLLGILRDLATPGLLEPKIDSHLAEALSADLQKLRSKEDELSLRLSSLKRRVSDMEHLKSSSNDYHKTLQILRDRLSISQWIEQEVVKTSNCPFCESEGSTCDEQLEMLIKSLKKTEDEISLFSEVPSSFDREYATILGELNQTASELHAIQKQIHAVAGESKQQQNALYTISEANRFIGRLEEALETFSNTQDRSALIEVISSLKNEISRFGELISGVQISRRQDYALGQISYISGGYIQQLDVESPGNKIELDIKSLTVVIKGELRSNYLWEIGSGSNWLAYHISVLLALHAFFIRAPSNPVPSFVIFDQPSQVYFPQKVYIPKDDGEYWKAIGDDDIESVRKIFSLMNSVSLAASGKLQILIFDHAPEEVWHDYSNVHLVATWRNGDKLVPSDWLS